MKSSDLVKIVLANAPLQNGNRGCAALTVSLLYIINRLFENSNVSVEFLLPDAQIKSWDFKNVCSIEDKIIKVIPITYNAPDSLLSSIRRFVWSFVKRLLGPYLKIHNKRNMFKDVDFILNIGQGDSFADIYGKERFDLIDRANRIAYYYKKPLCILPQTIGPFDNKVIRERARRSIEYAKMVMARDHQSLVFTKEIAPTVNVKEYIDVAFFMPYNVIPQSKDKIHVGLNVSALLWNGGYSRDNQFGLKCDYQHLIRSIIDYFLDMPDTILHLISHVVEPDSCIENDYEVSYNLWKEYNLEKVRIAPFALSPIDIKSYIAGMDFVIGARMHATIAAFSSGVPVVPMAYSRKFNGLFEDTLNYHHLADMKTKSEDEILSIIKDSFLNRSNLKLEVDLQNTSTVKERGKILEDDLMKFFGIC